MRNLIDKIVFFLLFLYFALKPIYIFSSGLPQIADFCMLGLFFILIFFKRDTYLKKIYDRKINSKLIMFLPFLLWITIISLICVIVESQFVYLKPILYYIFNFIALLTIKLLHKNYNETILNTIAKYISISCIVQFILSVIINTSKVRATGLFNNPNQLGLYALICFTYILYFKKYYTPKIYYISLFSSLYLILISLSKAAIIGAIGLIILLLIFKSKKQYLKVLIATILVIVYLSGSYKNIYTRINKIPLFNQAISRIERISSEKDSDLSSGRGYGRLKEIGLFVVTGVGEGGFNRFESLKGYEIHSAYASIICYYGIIGFTLLIYFIFNLISVDKYKITYLSGIILYGFTHQIWRNTLLWILFAIMLINNIEKENKKEENQLFIQSK